MKRFALLLSILLCLPLMAQKQTKHYNNSSQAFNELMAPWKEMYDAYRAKDGGALSYGNYEIRTGHGLDGEPAPCLWDAAAGKWIVAPATSKDIAWYKKQMKKKYQIPEGTREWDRMFFLDSQRGPMAGCPERFSLERDFFEPLAARQQLAGFRSEGYFIDIGIPSDYARAQRDFTSGAFHPYPYDALLLDRDGVINVLRPADYVKNIGEFVFCEGALEALRLVNPLFRRIVIVTNQRGVGRDLMTEADLEEVHAWMLDRIREAGGRIDQIYVCTDNDNSSPRRKPNIGMALEVRADYPDVDFDRSWFVGDSVSDLEFARRAGIPAFRVEGKQDLLAFARQTLSSVQS